MTGGGWRDARLEITYGEARSVIESQNQTMADIDDKAIQTVRINAILIGLLLTAANVAGQSVFHPTLFGSGIALLAGSILLGLVTFNESDLFVGPRGPYLVALTHGETTDSWDIDLLESLAGMVSRNDDEIDRTSKLLTITQAMLIGGIIAAILAVAI